jgi:tetratricopeptide (TPR) repeat protein
MMVIAIPVSAQTAANYQQAVQKADQLFKQGNYLDAKAYYQMALKFKSDDAHSEKQIKAIVEKLREQMQNEEEYYDIIDLADVFYDEKAYDKAKSEYRKALKIIPEDDYALGRIETIQRIEADEKDKLISYNLAMEEGNRLLSENKFDEADAAFREASRLLPDREQPIELIELTESLKLETAEKMVVFQQEMEEAERYLLIKNYIVALEHFEKAEIMAPTNKEVKAKIKEIASLANNQAEYNLQVAEADEFYINKDFVEAKKKYKAASKVWPENTYPADMIAKIDQMMAEKLKNLDQNYARSINSADSLYDLKEFNLAKGEYNLALSLKPDEKYPQKKLDEIAAYFANIQKEFEANYAGMITAADGLFNNKEYLQAKEQYELALTVKPDDPYPAQKITEIDEQLAFIEEQNKLDATYQEVLAEADKLLSNGHYDLAIKKYQEAQNIKSADDYPQLQILAIREMMVNAEKQREIDENYGKLILVAARLFGEGNLTESRNSYENALELKPYEELPKQKIHMIDSTVLAMERAAEIELVYNGHIQSGDSLLTLKEYDAAILAYEEAINLKPEGTEAREKAINARTVKANYERAVARQQKYDAAIELADQYFGEESFELAQAQYQIAADLIQDNPYPKQQLAEITILLKRLEAEKEQRYADAIAKADGFFELANYSDAVVQYKRAKSIKPAEQYPQQQIEICNTALAEELRRIQTQYNLAIADADKLYASKIYDKAINAYQDAEKIKPDEEYPRKQIKKITSYIEENAIVDIVNDFVTINSGVTEKFEFEPVKINVRKSNYVLVKARNLSGKDFKIIFTYGSKDGKNGGFVVQVPESEEYNDYIIRVGNQYKWFSEDNDWLSILPENGDIEIKMVRISTSD